MTNPSIYTVGGTVQAGSGVYIKRKADDELLELCRQGEFAFILSSRQVGKSSLMVRTAHKLENENIRSVIIDLSAIGVRVSVDEWYLGILNELSTTLNLTVDIFSWWEQFSQLGPAQRLTNFFKDVVLKEVDEQIVLFFDEIDSTLSIPFSDDFYIALRAAYNARSTTPEFKRLSFALVGVAAPSDLITDNKRTPFNVGRRVDLDDFTFSEAFPLAKGLGENADEVLKWVFEFTNGHPYLTQRLCAHLAKSGAPLTKQIIVKTVGDLFAGEQGRQDNNLQFVRDMLSKRSPDVTRVMQIYRDIRSGKKVIDDERSITKAHLKLSGLVRSDDGILRVRNEIYHQVFNLRWIRENTPNNWVKIAAFSFGIITFILLFIFVFDFVIDNSVSRKVDRFYGEQNPSVKLENLAQIFDAEGILPNSDYDSRARELFFSLAAKDQEALFMGASSESKAKYLPTVVRGLYVTMANVEGGQNSTVLLTIIKDSLEDVDNDSGLYREIDLWIRARNANKDEDKLLLYDDAISLNSENPSLFYDRAVVEIRMGQYENALNDLDATMRLAQLLTSEAFEDELATPTHLPTSTDTPLVVLNNTEVAPRATQTSDLALSPTSVLEPTPPAATPTLTATSTVGKVGITPTASPAVPRLYESYRSSFFSRAYIRSAVELVIQNNQQKPGFRDLLINADVYPSLATNGLLPFATAVAPAEPTTAPKVVTTNTMSPSELTSTFVQIAENVYVLDNETLGALESLDDQGTLTFGRRTTQMDLFHPGDILVGGSSLDVGTEVAPYGFLLRVVNFYPEQRSIVIETIPAMLDEVIVRADELELIIAIDLENIYISQDISNTPVGDRTAPVAYSPPYAGLSVDFNTLIYDEDGNNVTDNDQLRVMGIVTVDSPSFQLSLNIQNNQLQRLQFTNNLIQGVKIEMVSDVNLASLEKSVVVKRFIIKPQTFLIDDYLPIVITPEILILVGVEGQSSVGMSAGIQQSSNTTVGAAYQNENWNGIIEVNEQYINPLPTNFNQSAKLHVSVGSEIVVSLYGVPGPYGTTQGYLDLSADPLGELYGGVTGETGVKAQIFSVGDLRFKFNSDIFGPELLAQQDRPIP